MEYEHRYQHTIQEHLPLAPEDTALLWDSQPDVTQEPMTEPLPAWGPWPERWGIPQLDTDITIFDATTHQQSSDPEVTPPVPQTGQLTHHQPETQPLSEQPEAAHTVPSHEEDVPVLTSQEQYISELWRSNRLSPDDEQTVVEKARSGDTAAKNTLIESCLVYVLHMARAYHVYVEHDDLLDIVQVGNLAITEKLDQALEKATQSVLAYLFGVAKRSIKKYCLYRSRLIPVKDYTIPLSEFPQVTSLDALRKTDEGDESLPFDLSAPEPTIPPEADQQQLQTIRHALAHLTPIQRKVIEMRHGLTNNGALDIPDIASQLALPRDTVQKRYQRALTHLRERLRMDV